jgi:hypothetical protein
MNRHAAEVRVPCLYRRTWQDGFGARGWKLAGTANDPEVIASTAATGERIPTSVFVHDILDHFLCGLGPSGHRNEAVALLQLAPRTGADPTPDFARMVDEDLLQGRVLGETFREFLPPELAKTAPAGIRDGKAIVERLQEQLGPEVLRERLIARFFELGRAGSSEARKHYASQGLDLGRRGPLGLALQRLLDRADTWVQETNLEGAAGEIWITRQHCGFQIRRPHRWSRETAY